MPFYPIFSSSPRRSLVGRQGLDVDYFGQIASVPPLPTLSNSILPLTFTNTLDFSQANNSSYIVVIL